MASLSCDLHCLVLGASDLAVELPLIAPLGSLFCHLPMVKKELFLGGATTVTMSSIKLGILHPCVPARHQCFKGGVGSAASVMSPSLPHGCNALLNARLLPSSELGVRGWECLAATA